MKNGLNKISATTRKVWYANEKAIFAKYGEYRYRLVVNGLGEVEIYDLKNFKAVAKGNRECQKKIKELAA